MHWHVKLLNDWNPTFTLCFVSLANKGLFDIQSLDVTTSRYFMTSHLMLFPSHSMVWKKAYADGLNPPTPPYWWKLRSRYNIFIVRICVQQIVSFCLFGLVSVFVCQDSPEYSLQNPVRTYTYNVHHMVTRTQKVNMTDLHTDAQTNNMHHCISVCTHSSSQILYIRKHHLYMFCVHARKFKSMHGSSSPYTEVQNQSLAFLTLS